MSGAESPSVAWKKHVQHYRARNLKERRRTAAPCSSKIGLGEHSGKFLLRVDRMVKVLERVDRYVDPKDVDVDILSGLAGKYDAEVRVLERSSDPP